VDHANLEHKVGELDAENTQMAEDVALLEGTINEVRVVVNKAPMFNNKPVKKGDTEKCLDSLTKIKTIIS
jgi:hypothetical protein